MIGKLHEWRPAITNGYLLTDYWAAVYLTEKCTQILGKFHPHMLCMVLDVRQSAEDLGRMLLCKVNVCSLGLVGWIWMAPNDFPEVKDQEG